MSSAPRTRRTLRKGELCLIAIALAVLNVSHAHAQLTQPDGSAAPKDTRNHICGDNIDPFRPGPEVSLHQLFRARGEDIDPCTDARSSPETFKPTCEFSARYLLRETKANTNVAWYNAASGPVGNGDVFPMELPVPPFSADKRDELARSMCPTGGDLGACRSNHTDIWQAAGVAAVEFLTDDWGTDPANEFSNQFFATDDRYQPKGGQIGLAVLSSEAHYTESQYNPRCNTCSPPGPWYPILIYRSTLVPNAFYVAAEDLKFEGGAYTQPDNDGDYNDFVIYFEGLACKGANKPCDTGRLGICGKGLTDCEEEDGSAQCLTVREPEAEICNAVDDDCDGFIDAEDEDDLEGLCPDGLVCDRGRCRNRCASVEFPCPSDLVCTSFGTCVDPSCAEVTCEAGEICLGGQCVNGCEGATCPHGLSCINGRCIDLCEGLSCPEGLTCDAGACVPNCDCATCEEGVCDAASGLCVDDGCVGVSCAGGTHCENGTCVDDCSGAVCPGGAECTDGVCGEPRTAINTGEGGAGGGADSPLISFGGNSSTDDSNSGGSGQNPSRRRFVDEDDGSCGCRMPGEDRSGLPLALVALLTLPVARRWRRQRRRD